MSDRRPTAQKLTLKEYIGVSFVIAMGSFLCWGALMALQVIGALE